jgi:asparagine synthase (glutamine-hydrolysing)
MANSLETRVPFLDNDLVDFAQRVPVNLKLGNLQSIIWINENEPGSKKQKFFSKSKDGKLLLRNAMRKYVPENIIDGVKQGFSAPDASWFKGESIDYVRKNLFRKDALLYECLDRRTVLELINEHLEGRTNRRLLIWSLLNFEEWLRKFLGSE